MFSNTLAKPTYNLFALDNIGQVKRDSTARTRFYYLKDHLGDIRVTVNATSGIDSYFDYYPFGQILDGRSAVSSADSRYKYTGKERDTETGWDYFGARYYDSRIGRWLAVDPLVEKYAAWSPFAYAACSPIQKLDPDGKGVFDSKEALMKGGQNVVKDETLLPGTDGKTHCNLGAQRINALAGDHSLSGSANEMGDKLRDKSFATPVATQEEANRLANEGMIVFASFRSNPKVEPSGHIAVVAPTEGLVKSPSRKENVVSIFNVGKSNGVMPLSKGFGTREVRFFVENSDIAKRATLSEVVGTLHVEPMTPRNSGVTQAEPPRQLKPIM